MDLLLPPDFKEFLKLLKEHDVRYLLIGGMWVIMDMPTPQRIWIFGLPFIPIMRKRLFLL